MNNRIWWLLAFLVLVLAVSINLGEVPLKLEEPRRGLVGLEMQLSGDYILPSVNGEPYLKKSPLFNWVLIGAFKAFNSSSEWVIRLPTVISYLIVVWLLFIAGRKYINGLYGIFSGLLFASSVRVIFYAVNYAEIDMFFSLLLILSALGFYHFYRKNLIYIAFTWAYAFCSLGLLAKSLPALAFTGLSISLYLIIKRDFKSLFSVAHAAGILLMSAIVGLYLHALSGRISLSTYFQTLLRDSSERTVAENGLLDLILHTAYFPLEILWSLVPGSILLLFVWKFRRRFWQTIKQNDFILFCFVVFVGNIWLYWVSPSARFRYILMLTPFLMNVLLYFYWITDAEERKRTLYLPFTVLGILLTIGLLVAPFFMDTDGLKFWTLVITGILIGFIVFLFRNNTWNYLGGMIAIVLSLRIGFDLVVLPIRASGSSFTDKEDALRVSELLDREKIYVDQADAMYNGPMFYLTQRQNAILEVGDGKPGYYLLLNKRVHAADSLVYEFRNRSYSVVYRSQSD